jgi:hypothetical protein
MFRPILLPAAFVLVLACAHAPRDASVSMEPSSSIRLEALPPAGPPPSAQDLSWRHLQAIPQHTHMHVSAERGSATCYFISADESTLTCGRRSGSLHGRHTFARQDVRNVKLTRYAVSSVAGFGIGAGLAAVIGYAAAGSDKCTTNLCFDFFSRGDVAAVFAAPGALIGAAIMGPTDTFRGPTVYRR